MKHERRMAGVRRLTMVREGLTGLAEELSSDELFRSLAELLPDRAVFVVDAKRRVRFWSSGAERLLGFSPDEVVGEDCQTSNRCQRCMTQCGLSEHRDIAGAPLVLFHKNGTEVPVSKFARAFVAPDGSFAGGVEVLVAESESTAEDRLPVSEGLEDFHGLLSSSTAMRQVFQTCRNVAETDANALVRGESGTGKELIARALHAESARREGPFIAINCAALTPTLMESELFGHVRGAFTGAAKDRLGIFQQANGGTLFLDEVAELPLEMQAKLLRVLEERRVVPVGGTKAVALDIRIVSATHRSLRERVVEGKFREDLMFRLRVVPIFLPPLRERVGDVEPLLRRFVGQRSVRGPRVVERFSPDAMRVLLGYDWPGNVRELKNVIEYAFAVGRGPEIKLDDLPPELRSTPKPTGGLPDRGSAQRQATARALAAADGDLSRAAAELGISRSTLWRRRKRYGL